MRRRTSDYLTAGQVANLDQFASVTCSTVTGGAAHGCRALGLRVAGGIDVRVLPDRGFDIGAVRTLPRDADADGRASARLRNDNVGLELTLRWRAATLPRCHQWVHPAPGTYALALEPANCSVLGRAADRAAGRLPVLAAGEVRTTELEVRVDPVEP